MIELALLVPIKNLNGAPTTFDIVIVMTGSCALIVLFRHSNDVKRNRKYFILIKLLDYVLGKYNYVFNGQNDFCVFEGCKNNKIFLFQYFSNF
jgi:hypothetical protein